MIWGIDVWKQNATGSSGCRVWLGWWSLGIIKDRMVLFSERYGYTKVLRIGRWSFDFGWVG